MFSYTYHVPFQLSENSRQRLDRGAVLRVLDSKDAGDRALLLNAPRLSASLSAAARDRFARVRDALRWMEVPFEWDERLVRGLDYYSQTCWEFVERAQTSGGGGDGENDSSSSVPKSSKQSPAKSSKPGAAGAAAGLGASQSAVLAGGRYDSLAESLGGKHTVPAVGWAAGIERIKLLCETIPSLGDFGGAGKSHAAPTLAIVVHRTKTAAKRIAAAAATAAVPLPNQASPASSSATVGTTEDSAATAAEDAADAALVAAALRLAQWLRVCGVRVLPPSATVAHAGETSAQLAVRQEHYFCYQHDLWNS